MIYAEPAPTELAKQRRGQIVDAAMEIIATQGLHKLSLGNIEKRVKMTRGHLTYYFPTKEAILLAVMDRMVERIHARHCGAEGPKPGQVPMAEFLPHAFAKFLTPMEPEKAAFLSLVHTFKSQAGYREDVRKRLADLNREFREKIAADYAATETNPAVPPAVFAGIMIAVLGGLDSQLAVDPDAFDREAMLAGLLTVFSPLCASPNTTVGSPP